MFVAILVAKYFVVWNGIMAEHWCWNKELQEMNRGYVQETNQTKLIDFLKAMCSYNYQDQKVLPSLPLGTHTLDPILPNGQVFWCF